MIDYLIHAYRRGTDPFRSLSALSDMEAIHKMEDLFVEGAIFWERFKDPAQYLRARRQVEQWLRREFIAKGGKPPKFVRSSKQTDCLGINGEQIFPATLPITLKLKYGTTNRY
jgi:hypothetical protein